MIRAEVIKGNLRLGAALLFAVLFFSLLLAVRPTSAAVSVREFPVATAGSADELHPDIDGNIVAWDASNTGGTNIRAKNLSTGEVFQIAVDPGDQIRPAVSGDVVVWEDTSGADSDIYGYDLSTQKSFPIATGPGEQRWPDVAGRKVVWEDDSSGTWDISGYNLGTDQGFAVTAASGDQRHPAISGDTVVWQEKPDAASSDIRAKNLSTDRITRITADADGQDTPAISGETVVWRDERSAGNYDVYGYDLAGGREFQVSAGPGDQYSPAASGRVVVWADGSGGDADVYGKDLSTGERFAVASGSSSQEEPAVYGEKAVWETQRNEEPYFGTYDVYGANLDLAPSAPDNLSAAVLSDSSVELRWVPSTENDIAGYNVYRSGSPDGNYVRLNANLLPTPAYTDAKVLGGTRYSYQVTAVDAAGSESAASVSASVVVPKSSEVTLSTSTTLIVYNGTTTLSGRLTSEGAALSNRTVILEQRPYGATSFAPVPGGQLTTAADGSFTLVGVKPNQSTDYRAVFTSNAEGIRSSTSSGVKVDVKLLVSANTSASTIRRGSSLNISGTVLPEQTSGSIKLTIKRNGALLTTMTTPLNTLSRYSLTYKPPSAGTYQVTATLDGYPTSLITVGTKKFTVT